MTVGAIFRRHPDDERGAFLLLVAFFMVTLLTMVAITVDLGLARSTRRQDQSVADLAALAAGFFLSGRGTAATVSDPFGACEAAVTSAEANQSGFAPSISAAAACASIPTDVTTCTSSSPGMAPVQAVVTAGAYTLTVRYPIPETEITDPRFSGSGQNDGIDPDHGFPDSLAQCQRMRVTFRQVDQMSFARVVGVSSLATYGTAVTRGSTASTGQGTAALLLFDRVNCATLQNSGQASVTVQSANSHNPAVVKSDSAGQLSPQGNCTTNSNASGYVIYGPALPSGGGPSIIAQPAADGTAGVISSYSLLLSTPGRGGAVYPGGLSVAPTPSAISSRQPVDTKYNGTSAQISTLHTRAYGLVTSGPPAGYTVVSGTECGGTVSATTLASATQVYVNCPSGFSPGTNLFKSATSFVTNGNITIGSNKTLSLPNVRDFFVRGSPGGTAISIATNGSLLVNTGEAAVGSPDPFANGTPCSSRAGPGAGGTTANWSEVATFGGQVSVQGNLRLCQTFVYMAPVTNSATYVRQTVTAGNQSPENYPTIAACATNLPCPKNSVTPTDPFSVSGGQALADWTAPNQLSTQPTTADFTTSPFEDLALWNETSSTSSSFKGQGTNVTQGTYFLPNASVLFQGQGSAPITVNAQFLVRDLNLSGQGNLILSPNPSDSILTPVAGSYSLLR